ncbi:MAG: hypothetical protein LBH78_02310 [Rickettsiales bacterium]|jgi:hypothetical protein|nr:hypothetical protein [Rickettsiales bacterium]
MKNIFNKTNAPYLASGALAIGTLLASGIFAVAPYIGFLAPAAALSLGLPFIVGTVFSAVAIALSAVVINKNGAIRKQSTLLREEAKKADKLTLELKEKETQLARQAKEIKSKNNTISEKDGKISSLEKQLDKNEPFYDAADVQKEQEERQEKFENRVAQRKEEANERAKLKDAGKLPDVIALPYKNAEVSSQVSQQAKERVGLDCLDLAVPSSRQEKQANGLDSLDLATSKDLNHLNVEISSPKSQPIKEKASGYLDQAVNTANWLVHQAVKAMPYLVPAYLSYIFYGYATDPVSASLDGVNATQPCVANSSIINPLF